MSMKTTRRGPHRTTVLLVTGLVGALLIGTTGGAVAAGLITSKQIKNGTIKAVDIKNNTITGKKIRNGSVTTKDVKNGSLKAKDIKTSSLTGALVKDGSLTGADVTDGSLTGVDVADGALTGAHLADGTVASADLGPDARLWAVVNAAGTLARGTDGVTSETTNVGTYRVFFPIDVDQCSFAATIGNADSGVPLVGIVTATPLSADESAVVLTTYDLAGD